ncbi:MAG: BMP family ABC transporter substrate-binding protein [Deltaproteobacteria bacterium]|nr:BMP family ABC transporter substrate-binding protein [Kofleriaceae bacterium]
MTAARIIGGLVALNLALLVTGDLIAPSPPAPAARDVERPASGAGVTIGLVFDVGGRGDRSFNDAAWRGLEWAERDYGIEIVTIEPSDGADREAALRQLAAKRVDLVIGVGFIFSADLEKLARRFPSVSFAGVDYAPTDPDRVPPNLAGLRFREHEGSFLVGAIAGMTTKSKVVGFVGGMKIPLIRKFEAGYEAGVKHVCPTCRVLAAYAGTEPKAFADPMLGQELASAQFDRGADVIYHASGKTGAGVIAAAAERRKLVIGVDSDQFHEAPCCVLTSMIKRVDVAVHEIVGDVIAGRFQGGVRELGLAEDGVGFVADANNAKLLREDVGARARELAAQIIAGQIEVPAQ